MTKQRNCCIAGSMYLMRFTPLSPLMCGAAVIMNLLIASRAIAGLGGGGIFSLVVIIIADIVPVKERGKYNGLVGACFGIASVAGPLVGGAFVDKVSWRWVFYINLPLGVITVAAVVALLKLPRTRDGDIVSSLTRIDWVGTFLLVGAVICILIPLQGVGSLYAWKDPIVISLLVVGGVLTIAFVYVEAKWAANAVIPLSMFKDIKLLAAMLTSFFGGCAFFTLVFYLPSWLQVVLGVTATQAGVRTIPLIMGVVIFSIVSGFVSSTTGQAYFFLPTGAVATCLGAALLSTLSETSPLWTEILFPLVAGAGVGCTIQTVILVAQFTARPDQLAIVTENVNFFQTISAVLGLAICSVTFNSKLQESVFANLAAANQTLTFTVPYVDRETFFPERVVYQDCDPAGGARAGDPWVRADAAADVLRGGGVCGVRDWGDAVCKERDDLGRGDGGVGTGFGVGIFFFFFFFFLIGGFPCEILVSIIVGFA
ncbi:major facilitator superfamily domain-containing protein [Zopfochytrium polystomum]|nr:major facilitator superfamily domain-containing protein [Zopfochytrium polystomum]